MVLAVVHSRPAIFPEPYLDIQPAETPWRVKGVLPSHGVAFLVGATKAGKSFLAIDTALRIATGAKVLNRTTHQCGVAYIAAEDSPGCRARVAAWRRKFRRENDVPFDLYGHAPNLLDPQHVTDTMDALEESCARFEALGHPLGVIVIDTLSRCLPGVDENASPDMSRSFVALQQIGLRFHCLMLVLAHFGKAGEERGIRGWSGMDSNSDATITLERDTEDQELRTLTLAKVKNGRDGGKVSFRLEDVDLGMIDSDGDPITSCICAFERTPPEKKVRRKAMNPAEHIVFQAIRELSDGAATQPIPQDIPGARPWHKGVGRAQLAMQLMGTAFAYEGEKQDATRMRLNRAIQGLVAQGRVRNEQDLIWMV